MGKKGCLALKTWIKLKQVEYDSVWDRFYENFHFRPSVNRWEWPSFVVPSPFITFDISTYYEMPEPDMDELHDDLKKKVVEALIGCTPQGALICALDWQHACYWVDPRTGFSTPVPEGVFKIPFIPDGDYYFFLANDLRWGYLGHPWEASITIFGCELVKALLHSKPLLFHKVIRQG